MTWSSFRKRFIGDKAFYRMVLAILIPVFKKRRGPAKERRESRRAARAARKAEKKAAKQAAKAPPAEPPEPPKE